MQLEPADVLTILYADVENSTLESQTHGRAYELAINRFHKVSKELIAARGGSYALNMGDGFVAMFDSPIGAVRCSIDPQTATPPARWDAGLPPLRGRIGV